MTKVPEKLVIAITNPLICYLIIEVDYINLFLVNKLIILGIEFEVLEETCFTNVSLVKLRRMTRSSQCIAK